MTIDSRKTGAAPADRVARIRGLAGAAVLSTDVAALLDQIAVQPELPRPPALLREMAARYTAAWCSQNALSVAAFFSPRGSLRINGGAPAAGRPAIEAAAQEFMTTFPDMKVLMDDLLALDDRAIYCWSLVGTNTGPGGTGRAVKIGGFEVWRIGADSLIAESQGHFDAAEYARQLGAQAGEGGS